MVEQPEFSTVNPAVTSSICASSPSTIKRRATSKTHTRQATRTSHIGRLCEQSIKDKKREGEGSNGDNDHMPSKHSARILPIPGLGLKPDESEGRSDRA